MDERYLGINAKAKAAESADIATEAETAKVADSVLWGGVSEKPKSFYPINYGGKITVVSASASYTCTKGGLMHVIYSSTWDSTSRIPIKVNNTLVGYLGRGNTSDNPIMAILVQKGDLIEKSNAVELALFPIKE